MTLGAKFNLTLLGVFGAGLVAAALVVRKEASDSARQSSLRTAGLMIESAMAIRKYTSEQIRPLLIGQLEQAFHPQTVPAYSAVEMFESMRKEYPDYTYKEATLNPSNLRDKATDWEANLVEQFRNFPDKTQLVGTWTTPTGENLYVARPIQVKSDACLKCHGDRKDLPKTVREKYGEENGVGWKMNEIVGAQIASVPTSVAEKQANRSFFTFLGMLVAVFLGLMVALNVLLNRIVIAPIKRMAAAADKASQGDLGDEEMDATGSDEVGSLAASFNRMTRSLKKAMEMIGHD